jgi:hypothetical protein
MTSSPAYTGLTRDAAGGGVNGDQPPNDDASRPLRSGPRATGTSDGNDLSNATNSPYPSDPLKGLTRFQMTKLDGKESQYEYWKLQSQASYGS